MLTSCQPGDQVLGTWQAASLLSPINSEHVCWPHQQQGLHSAFVHVLHSSGSQGPAPLCWGKDEQSQHLAVGPAAFLIFFTFSTGAILACLLVLFPFPPRNSSAAGNHVFSCKAINGLYRNYLSQFKFRVIRLMTACKRVHMRCNFKQSFNKPDHFYISCTLETLDSHIYMEEVKSVLCRTVGKHALCLLLHSDCENCSFE